MLDLVLGIAPFVRHLDTLVTGVPPQGQPCHLQVHRHLVGHALRHVIEHLVHARQFEDQLSPGLQDSLPFRQHLLHLPEIEMLDDMDGGRYVCISIGEGEASQIGFDLSLVHVDVDPSGPMLSGASELELNS